MSTRKSSWLSLSGIKLTSTTLERMRLSSTISRKFSNVASCSCWSSLSINVDASPSSVPI